MDVIEICRCCLTNNDPFLTIYEGGATSEYCLAAMLKKITGLQADPDDKLPDKVCLLCTRDIIDFNAFQKKCEMSHRTLQQLLLSNEDVQQCSPIENLQSMDATDKENLTIVDNLLITPVESVQYIQTEVNENITIVDELQMTPVESVEYIQTNVNGDNSQRVNFVTNVELEIPINYVSKCTAASSEADKSISKPNSPIPLTSTGFKRSGVIKDKLKKSRLPISFHNSPAPVEAHLENCKQTAPIPITEILNSDSEMDSWDSIEFISENREVNEEFVKMCNTHQNANANDSAAFSNMSEENKCRIKNYVNHRGENPFKCKYCDKKFKRSINRDYHERLHYGQTKLKCQYCNMKFYQLNDKNRHENTHKYSVL